MKSSWTNGLNADEKGELASSFDASGRLRSRLVDMLKKKQEVCRKDRLSDANYADANWAYKQADAVGYQRALQEIIDLL